MAWKDVNPMEERIRFVLKAAREKVSFSDLCQEFGVSRKTGYKWLDRYEKYGLEGMRELSRRPLTSPNALEDWLVELIIKEKRRHPTWGPKKLFEVLAGNYELERAPAASTIGYVLGRHGLVKKKPRRRATRQPNRGGLTEATHANEVWGADFKGWFRTGDGNRCDPLTVSDLSSRYVLKVRSVAGQSTESTMPEFRKAFIAYGLPEAIRVDNGPPFGSRGVLGLSRLSAWWLRLGIRVEFIAPGEPQQNGVHERMHRTLKYETAKPPAATLKAQQRRFDRWLREFNHERPHEALGMQRPAQRYRPSPRRYQDRPEPPEYPTYYQVRKVRTDGSIKWRGEHHYIGEALHGMALGLNSIADQEHEVYFGGLLLGYLNERDPGSLRPTASGARNHTEPEREKV